jgi:hypothetical protein
MIGDATPPRRGITAYWSLRNGARLPEKEGPIWRFGTSVRTRPGILQGGLGVPGNITYDLPNHEEQTVSKTTSIVTTPADFVKEKKGGPPSPTVLADPGVFVSLVFTTDEGLNYKTPFDKIYMRYRLCRKLEL